MASAAIATTVAAAAHTLAGGGAPPWWLLVATTLLASPVALALVGRAPSLRRTTAVVLIAQGLLHLTFASVGTADMRSGAGHGAHQGAAGHAWDHLSTALPPAVGGHLHLDAGMIAAHVLAAAATVVLLAHGERLLRVIARGLRRLLTSPVLTLPRPRGRVATLIRVASAPAAAFLTDLSRRGPPALRA